MQSSNPKLPRGILIGTAGWSLREQSRILSTSKSPRTLFFSLLPRINFLFHRSHNAASGQLARTRPPARFRFSVRCQKRLRTPLAWRHAWSPLYRRVSVWKRSRRLPRPVRYLGYDAKSQALRRDLRDRMPSASPASATEVFGLSRPLLSKFKVARVRPTLRACRLRRIRVAAQR